MEKLHKLDMLGFLYTIVIYTFKILRIVLLIKNFLLYIKKIHSHTYIFVTRCTNIKKTCIADTYNHTRRIS